MTCSFRSLKLTASDANDGGVTLTVHGVHTASVIGYRRDWPFRAATGGALGRQGLSRGAAP